MILYLTALKCPVPESRSNSIIHPWLGFHGHRISANQSAGLVRFRSRTEPVGDTYKLQSKCKHSIFLSSVTLLSFSVSFGSCCSFCLIVSYLLLPFFLSGIGVNNVRPSKRRKSFFEKNELTQFV